MGLFRKATPPHQTALAMIGVRAGDRLLAAGRPEPAVIAELARSTGLSGQTLVVSPPSGRTPYDKAAADAGVLIEVIDAAADTHVVPQNSGDHDVVVLHFDLVTLDVTTRDRLAISAFSAVRPSGRVVVIEGRAQTGWFSTRSASLTPDDVMAMLTRAGGIAVRHLSTADGVMYFEARKPR